MMTDQVTTIEQSRMLLDLGIPAEEASMVWRIYRLNGSSKEWQLEYFRTGGRSVGDDGSLTQTLPAFTVGDLIRLLPYKIGDYAYYLTQEGINHIVTYSYIDFEEAREVSLIHEEG